MGVINVAIKNGVTFKNCSMDQQCVIQDKTKQFKSDSNIFSLDFKVLQAEREAKSLNYSLLKLEMGCPLLI